MQTFIAGILLAMFVGVPSGTPKVYRNQEFGITLRVPDGALLCVQPADRHNHGPHMLGPNEKPEPGDVAAWPHHQSLNRGALKAVPAVFF